MTIGLVTKVQKQLLAAMAIFAVGIPISLKYSPPVHGAPPAAVVTTSTTMKAGYHSMCDSRTGECYDPGADYVAPDNDPQYYGY